MMRQIQQTNEGLRGRQQFAKKKGVYKRSSRYIPLDNIFSRETVPEYRRKLRRRIKKKQKRKIGSAYYISFGSWWALCPIGQLRRSLSNAPVKGFGIAQTP